MRMLMPSHAKNVKPSSDTQPIFTRFGIESQLDAMFQPVVQLRSGGYIVHQPDRGAGRDRRELRPRDARASYRGHRAQDQPRSGRRDRAAASAARPRRPHRDRLHRHGREAQQPHGRAAAEGSAQARSRAHPGRPHLAFRPAGNVAAAHPHRACSKARRTSARTAAAPATCARCPRSRCSCCARSRKCC